MCQMSPNCAANPFTDASRQLGMKRPRTPTEDKLAPVMSSPSSIDAMQHYSLRIKRVRTTTTAVTGPAFSQASPYSMSSKVKTRPQHPSTVAPNVSVSRDLNGEVKTLQRKVLQMQEQVKDAADGIRQLRQLVSVLAMQRQRAAMLAARAQSVQC